MKWVVKVKLGGTGQAVFNCPREYENGNQDSLLSHTTTLFTWKRLTKQRLIC